MFNSDYLLQNIQMGYGAHPALYSVGNDVLSRKQSGWGVRLAAHLCLELRLRITGPISLLLRYAFMRSTGKIFPFLSLPNNFRVSACRNYRKKNIIE